MLQIPVTALDKILILRARPATRGFPPDYHRNCGHHGNKADDANLDEDHRNALHTEPDAYDHPLLKNAPPAPTRRRDRLTGAKRKDAANGVVDDGHANHALEDNFWIGVLQIGQ